MSIRFNEIRDGEPILASHINGYGQLLSRLLATIDTTESGLITETLELDELASVDQFTGDNLHNIYKTQHPLLTALASVTVTRNGVTKTEDPLAVDWLAGRLRLEPSTSPLTVVIRYKYLTRVEELGNKTPFLVVEDQPLYWPTMADIDENENLVIRSDGLGDYLITASPSGTVRAIKVRSPEIVDNLDSTDSTAVLSANQGRTLALKTTKALLAEPPSIDPSIVRDLIGCAMTYLNHTENFIIGSAGTLFDSNVDPDNPRIDNVSLIQACIQGIPYEYSRYTTDQNTRHFKYGITLPDNPYRSGRYSIEELARYLTDTGYAFYPNIDCSNISPGDLVFVGPTDTELDDSLLVVGYKDPDHLTCIRVGDKIEFYDLCLRPSKLDPNSSSEYNGSIRLCARPAYNPTVGLDPRPILNDTTPVTTTSAKSTLKSYILPVDLKPNMSYTLVVKCQHVFSPITSRIGYAVIDQSILGCGQTDKDFLVLRAKYADASTEILNSWQFNSYPTDGLYYMKFVTGTKPIMGLTLSIDAQEVAGHSVRLVQLYEGLVRPTKLHYTPKDRTIYTRLPEASACYRGQLTVLNNGSGVDVAYICLQTDNDTFEWVSLDPLLPTSVRAALLDSY